MHSGKIDPREMTDEERLNWTRELKSRQTGWQGCAGVVGFCSFHAIHNPVRKKILRVIEEVLLEQGSISELTVIEDYSLTLQIAILEDCYLITIEEDKIDLTPCGVTFVRANNISVMN